MAEKERIDNEHRIEDAHGTRAEQRDMDKYYADKAAYESELPENAQGQSNAIPPSDPRATQITSDEELLRRDRRERAAGIKGTPEQNKRVLENPDPHEGAA